MLARMDITGASAIVTGGASGIGAAAARALAARGAIVVVADINAELGEALADEIKGVFARVDVTDTEQIAAAVEAAAEIAPLRACVNSAGIGWAQRTIGRDGELASAHDLGAFRKVVEINLIGTFDMTRQAATVMSRNEPDADGQRGAIVNLASVAAFDGQIGQSSYSASKGGVVGMTLPIARDLSAVGDPPQHGRARTDRHPDLRRLPQPRRVQGQPRPERAVPQAPRPRRGAREHGRGVHHQLLHERRDHPRRRRHPDAPEVAGGLKRSPRGEAGAMKIFGGVRRSCDRFGRAAHRHGWPDGRRRSDAGNCRRDHHVHRDDPPGAVTALSASRLRPSRRGDVDDPDRRLRPDVRQP